MIDKGKLQGIETNMAVVVARGLVGRVMELGLSTSRVILLTDPDARVSAIAQKSRAHGIVKGNGRANLVMDYLDLDSGVEISDVVLSSDVGGLIPKGIPIGRIERIGRNATGLHLEAHVVPFVQFNQL